MISLRLAVTYLVVTFLCAEAFHVPAAVSPQNVQSTSSSLHANNGLSEPVTDRRGALKASGVALLSLLLGEKANAAADPQTILITGSNSGIGFEAAKILAERGHTLILACRTLDKAKDAIQRIDATANSGTLIPAECNLASLESIKSFVKDLKVDKLDVVCLNAGLCLNVDDKQIQRTAEGFELTGRLIWHIIVGYIILYSLTTLS
jgi:hypothetical protein